MNKVIEEIAAERLAQVKEYGVDGDDRWTRGELANTAGVYAIGSASVAHSLPLNYSCVVDLSKPRRRQLIIAAALIVAEIERLDRAEAAASRAAARTEPYDHRKACYADAFRQWRDGMRSHPNWKPSFEAFGLSADEAADIEANGYDTSGLPAHLRWHGKPLTDEQYAKLDAARPSATGGEGEHA